MSFYGFIFEQKCRKSILILPWTKRFSCFHRREKKEKGRRIFNFIFFCFFSSTIYRKCFLFCLFCFFLIKKFNSQRENEKIIIFNEHTENDDGNQNVKKTNEWLTNEKKKETFFSFFVMLILYKYFCPSTSKRNQLCLKASSYYSISWIKKRERWFLFWINSSKLIRFWTISFI